MIVYKTPETQTIERYALIKGVSISVAIEPTQDRFYIIRKKSVDAPIQWIDIGNSIESSKQYIDYYL